MSSKVPMGNGQYKNSQYFVILQNNILKANKTHCIDNFKKNYDSIFRK